MTYIRPSWLFVFLGVFISACASQENIVSDTEKQPFVSEGFHLTSTHPTPFDSVYARGVAKVFIGNSFTGSGAFISRDGLFLTTYEPVLSLISGNSQTKNVINGFSSKTTSDEIPIPGLALLVLTEERDVTSIYEDQIPEGATNSQIARLRQQITQSIIREERGASNDLLVQVTDLYSGNRQILSIYKVLNDVRLVWSDDLSLTEAELSDSNRLLNSSSGKVSLLRVYTDADGHSIGYNTSNVPYSAKHHFRLSEELPEQNDVIALGFPDRTFRSETYRALNFYYTLTNPSIVDAYVPLQLSQDINAQNNTDYLYASLYQRYNTATQVSRYKEIQELFSTSELLELKVNQESEFQAWSETDTTTNPSYKQVFTYINQAFDIAEQNGSSFYATNYAIQLGRIDDLANQVKVYYEQSALAQTDQELEDLRALTLHNINQLLQSINIDAELEYLSHSLASLHSIPEEQQLPSLDRLFEGVDDDGILRTARMFLERQKLNSFLFNVDAVKNAIENETTYDDSLFTVLDEILFVNDMNRNNHAIYLAYLQPAQQVFIRALMEKKGIENYLPDANGTLRYNLGHFNKTENEIEADHIITANDFSANGSGSAVLSPDGLLLGIVNAENSAGIFSNYFFNSEAAYLKSRNIPKLFRSWEEKYPDIEWFQEISSPN